MELSLSALSEKYDRLPEENIQRVNMGITGMGTPNVAIVKSDTVESVVFKAERHHTYCVRAYGDYNRLIACFTDSEPENGTKVNEYFRQPIINNLIKNREGYLTLYASDSGYIMVYLCNEQSAGYEVAVFDLGVCEAQASSDDTIDLSSALYADKMYLYGAKKQVELYKKSISFFNNISCVFSEERSLDFAKNTGDKRILVILADDNIASAHEQYLTLKQYQNCMVVHAKMLMPHKHLTFGLLKALECRNFIDLGNNTVTISNDDTDKSDRGEINIAPGIYNAKVCAGNIRVQDSFAIFLEGNNANVTIGDNTSFIGVYIRISFDSSISIGNDCMMSNGISIVQPDQHCIFDLETGKRRNMFKNITIGNHVWVGKGVSIWGGAVIPDNCILGAATVTSGKFTEKNCILAGNPARVIRKNIVWARDYQGNRYEDYSECYDQDAMKYI